MALPNPARRLREFIDDVRIEARILESYDTGMEQQLSRPNLLRMYYENAAISSEEYIQSIRQIHEERQPMSAIEPNSHRISEPQRREETITYLENNLETGRSSIKNINTQTIGERMGLNVVGVDGEPIGQIRKVTKSYSTVRDIDVYVIEVEVTGKEIADHEAKVQEYIKTANIDEKKSSLSRKELPK